MKKQVSIARALKEKNRVAGKLKHLRALVASENSKDKKLPRRVVVEDTYAEAKEMRDRLVSVKSAIAVANQPIISKIIEMEEAKSELTYVSALNTREGKFSSSYREDAVETEIEAVITQQDVLQECDELRQKIENLQDEIDEFNAVTKVEIELD